jgi:hypothetical protein
VTVTINTWVNVADTTVITGVTVQAEDVTAAQVILETLIHRVWRPTDAARGDYVWLQRAVAWQAVFLAQHPEVKAMMGVSSLSQDGMSLSFPSEQRIFISPLARQALDNLFRASNSTIRMNSAFQRNRRNLGDGTGGTMPWRSI